MARDRGQRKHVPLAPRTRPLAGAGWKLTLGCWLSRGNSKYHYYGIRLKPDSPLNRLQEDTQYMAMRQQPTHQKPRWVACQG